MRYHPIRAIRMVLLAALLVACESTTPAPTPPAPSPVPAPTAIAAPAAAPAPELLAQGLRHRAIGEYATAAEDFHALIERFPTAAEVRPARFYLAESFTLRGLWTSAADALRAFRANGPPDAFAAQALFLLARSHEQAGAWAEADTTYAEYQALGTPLAPYAQLRRAAQQRALGQTAAAAASYAAVARTPIARGERAGAHEKAIALYRELGQSDQVLKLYVGLLALAEQSTYQVRILSEASVFARSISALDQARTWERELVATDPATSEAQAAVEALQADPAAIGPADAAHVYESNELFAKALPLLDTAIAQADTASAPDLRRRRALALRATGDIPNALAELASISAADPNSPVARQALLDYQQTRGQNNELEAAIVGYRQFAHDYPSDANAPVALDRAAQLLERQGDSAGATAQRRDLGQRYPASELGQNALDAVGWQCYRANRLADARAAWELLAKNAEGAIAARAAAWAARAVGSGTEADALLDQAAQVAPESYYGVRAAEQRGRFVEATTPLSTTTSAAEWHTAETWIAAWSGKPVVDVATQGYPATLLAAGAIQRALALAAVNLDDDAVAEWNEARDAANQDAPQLYLLARLASANDQPYIALKASEDVLALAPRTAPAAPVALQRLRFPTPYREQVMAWAATYDLDPRALYALLRQESLFNPNATSWVGARGLAQVMPETAQGIANRLNVEPYSADDLYRPTISIRFGAAYLSDQIATMQGSLPGGLAAYNGGLGNAMRWAGGDTIADQDAFVEAIDYPETEGYVKLIYSYYAVYRRLYGG